MPSAPASFLIVDYPLIHTLGLGSLLIVLIYLAGPSQVWAIGSFITTAKNAVAQMKQQSHNLA